MRKVLIVGNLHSHPSASAFLEKLLTVLQPLCSTIVLVSGDLPESFDGRVEWIRTELMDKRERFLKRFLGYLKAQLDAALRMHREFRKGRPEIAVFLGSHLILLAYCKISGARVIRHQGGSYSRQSVGSDRGLVIKLLSVFFEKLPSMISDRIVVESPSCISFQDLEEYASKVEISAMYVDQSIFFVKKDLRTRAKIVGFVGGLDLNKGITNFVEAVCLMKNYFARAGAKAVIGGSGPLDEWVRNRIEIAGMTDLITILGWIPHARVPDCLNELQLLVVPSFSEGVPNIILEAMACGTPVLATSVGGIPDIISNGRTGILTPTNSPEALASEIERALEETDLEGLSIQASKLVQDDFGLNSAIKRWRRILDGSKGHRSER